MWVILADEVRGNWFHPMPNRPSPIGQCLGTEPRLAAIGLVALAYRAEEHASLHQGWKRQAGRPGSGPDARGDASRIGIGAHYVGEKAKADDRYALTRRAECVWNVLLRIGSK
jgi:hypothetical protein